MTSVRSRGGTFSAVVALLWLGLLAGISFLATPAKFLAPSLTLAVALDVGRQTFAVFSVVETVLAMALLLMIVLMGPFARLARAAAILVAACVAVQSLWLLPALDARVETILQGGVPASAHLHELYIGLDLAKLALLGVLAWRGLGSRPSIGHGALLDGS